MEYENKEAKKLFRWFLLCSVIILLLTGTVTTFMVRNYRVRENEAITALLAVVLQEEKPDAQTIAACMRILEHPQAYQKSHHKERKEAEKILQSYGISEDQPVIAGTKNMERRILMGALGGVLLVVCLLFIRNGEAVDLRNCPITWKRSPAATMIWHWRIIPKMN